MAVKHISFWEVSTFKHLTFFHPRYMKDADGHQRFREFLASTLLTGGKSLDIETPYTRAWAAARPAPTTHRTARVTSSRLSLATASTSAPTAALGATPTAQPVVARILLGMPSAPLSRGVTARTTTAAVCSPSSPCASTSRRRLLRRALPPGIRRAPRAPRPSASAQALCQRLRQPVHRLAPTSARRAPVDRGPCMACAKFESPHPAGGVRGVTFAGA